MFCGLALHVHAQDDREHVLAKPSEFTDVLDAFEHGALPDFNVGLSYRRTHARATVARERIGAQDAIAGRYVPIAVSSQTINALGLELAVGVYSDLMVYGRLPLVLSDTRNLRTPSGVRTTAVPAAPRAGSAEPLFELDVDSKTRSGMPGLDLGVAWGVVNQYRKPYLPTWVLSLETRLGFGRLIEACRDGTGCSSGINRGTSMITLGSRWSYRVHWAEPYVGLRYMHEWATSASGRFAPHGDQPGYVQNTPPSVQELTLGTALVAWEDRARFQRLAIDVRGYAAHVSAGRDYSALFDALGTSTHPELAQPYETSSGDEVPFTGLTQVASHARFAAELALATQAARYIRFRLGFMLSHVTAHWLTDAVGCAVEGASPCPSDRVNLLYRPVIDMPGQRFLQMAALSYDLFANASGEF
ncbi:MAG: hypothetical protein ABW321_04890 [Polyangiales bacterium]